jgi:hypothetical protein
VLFRSGTNSVRLTVLLGFIARDGTKRDHGQALEHAMRKLKIEDHYLCGVM